MRTSLDFLYEHSLDKQLYCVLPAADGELQLSWHAADPSHWEARHASSGPAQQVPRADLISYLTERGADLVQFERELASLVAAHVVVADELLRAAHGAFGADRVSAMLRGQQHLVDVLRQTLTRLLPRRLKLVH